MNFSQLGFGAFVLRINGILLALIFCLVVWLFFKKLKEEGLDTDFLAHHLWRWVVAGIIVGRLLALALYPEAFSAYGWTSFIAFWEGGINFFGVFLGSFGFMIYDLKKTGHDPLRWLDLLTVPMLVGICLSDLAGFITGATYGTETSLPWGVQYETFGVDTIAPVHPVTIYAFLIHLLLLNWVLRYGKSFYRQHGKLAIITSILFFFAEFFLQFWVGNPTIMVFGEVRIEQVFSLLIVAGLTFVYKKLISK